MVFIAGLALLALGAVVLVFALRVVSRVPGGSRR